MTKKAVHAWMGLAACALLASCSINESFVDGYGEDPNLPTDAPTEKVFIAGQVGAIVFHEGYAARIANMWSQHFVTDENQYLTIYNYAVTAQDFDPIWSVAYVRALANLRIAQAKARQDGGKENLVAIAQINEALLMGTLAALFGDVPNREATDDLVSDPVFEPQAGVYADAIALLDEAIATLTDSPRNLSGGIDIYSLAGSATRWIKVAHTLRARFYLHLSGQDASKLQNVVDATAMGIDEETGRGDLRILHGTVVNEDVNLWSAFTSDRAWLFAEGGHAMALLERRGNSKTDEASRISRLFRGRPQVSEHPKRRRLYAQFPVSAGHVRRKPADACRSARPAWKRLGSARCAEPGREKATGAFMEARLMPSRSRTLLRASTPAQRSSRKSWMRRTSPTFPP